MKRFPLFLPLFFALTACGASDAIKIRAATFEEMDGWAYDRLVEPLKLFVDSCAVNATRSNAYTSKAEGAVGDRALWREVCAEAGSIDPTDEARIRQFFEARFQPHKVETEAQAMGLFTGYYEPIINGSRTRTPPFTTPVYGVPADLRKPYLTREEIVRGDIGARAPVLLYVDDPVKLFFLHVQGSGKVRLPDGSLIGLQYAAQNGHEYVPIGRTLKESGALSTVSMQTIRDWLLDHPEEMDAVMNANPSYVFFKFGPGDKAAKGAIGLPLTPLRSLAIDDDRAAYGVPTYIDTVMSEYPTGTQIPLKRLFVSQDTGGALHSPHRGDIFFGQGEEQEWQAGHQNARGNVYWLLPKPVALRPEKLPVPAAETVAPPLPVEVSEPEPLTPTPDVAREPLLIPAQEPIVDESEAPAAE